jgi:DNA-binding GntR family transcriptional regulator
MKTCWSSATCSRPGRRNAPRVRATAEDRERVRQCLAMLEQSFAGQDLDHQVDSDLAFHQAIAEASHNVIVGHLTASLLRLMRDNLRRNLSELMQVPAAREALLDQHRAVWRAIEQGDAGLPWRRRPATSVTYGKTWRACCAATRDST